jgi:hypothetical protein
MANILFNKIDYTLGSLVDEISSGQLGLPEIQRPFVWKNTQVRDLFDSMYRGYPIGYLLFWETGASPGARQIGTDGKQLVPSSGGAPDVRPAGVVTFRNQDASFADRA